MKADKENKVARMKATKQQHLQKQKGQTFQQASTLQNEVIIGKNHALKKYDQFALNTSCFWGSLTELCNFTKFVLQN